MLSIFINAFRALGTLFRPPFAGLWAVVIAYYVWCFFVYPHSAILSGDLPDTDDYTYLNQVLDWLAGQGWYDNIQHRLDPPNGVPIHFSRLTQIPMAGLILLIEACGLPPTGAATLTAAVYPLILLGVFFAAIRWTAAALMPRDWAGVTAAIALFIPGMMFMFRPGHLDHHGLNIILITLTVGCVARLVERSDHYRWAVGAGLLLALSQTVALEVLPWLIFVSGWIGLWAATKGGPAARSGWFYALALTGGSMVGLALTRPPTGWLTFDVLSYSVVYVMLTGGVLLAFTGILCVAKAPMPVRWAIGGVLAGGGCFLFLRHFPDLIGGPYGGMDPALAQIILGEITEAQPFKTERNSWFAVSLVTTQALLALGTGLWILRRANKGADRWRWGLPVLMLAVALGLTVFYQRRFIAMTGMLTIIPLAVLLQRGWAAIDERLRGRPRTYAEIGLLLLVGPLLSVLYPAMADGRPFNTGVLLFPAISSKDNKACNMYVLEKILRDKVFYGDRPRLIMSTISAGPELLFRSSHSVLSAPYHMDVNGNVDATRFFSTPYPEEAESIARRRGVDLIVACRAIPEMYLRPMMNKPLSPGESAKDFAPHFIERLMRGETPKWLKNADIPGLNNFVIYEVLPANQLK